MTRTSIRQFLLAGVVLATPTIAFGQDKPKPGEEEKARNDQPGRPLQMPPASSEAREAFDDFERFGRRGAWERATKALYAIPEAQAERFVDGEDGFIISVARKRREVLEKMSPEGQAAYRLFHDSDAKKLLEGIDGSNEQKVLEQVFSSYFLTSEGDNAADRLGDLYFEQGRFSRAAECWKAILRDRNDSELSPAVLTVKVAWALARLGRPREVEALRRDRGERFAKESVTIAGRKATVTDQFNAARELADKVAASSASATNRTPEPSAGDDPKTPIKLTGTTEATWQVRFGDSITAGMSQPELDQWENNNLSTIVPPVAIDGSNLFVNFLGNLFTVSLDNGKMLWRTGSFHNVDVQAMGNQAQMVDQAKFAVLADSGLVWTMGRDLKNPNYMAPYSLTCRRAGNGDILWQSTSLGDLSGLDILGPPVFIDGKLLVVAKTSPNANNNNRMMMMQQGGAPGMPEVVAAIRPSDGKLLWKTEVGLLRQNQRYYYYYNFEPSQPPRLMERAGSLYLDTQLGVLTRLDVESGDLQWGYAYLTDPASAGSRFFFGFSGGGSQSSTSSGTPISIGDAIVFKGAKGEKIHAIDPDSLKPVWDRSIGKSSRLIGIDDKNIYLAGDELSALDIKTRAMKWSCRLPGGSEQANVVIRPDGIWQMTSRGVFELDPDSGAIRQIFRGDDSGSVGGNIVLTDRWLLTITNQTISAYPRTPAKAAATARAGEPVGLLVEERE